MEDLYKDDPNSWLRRTRFSKTVYHHPDLSQVPICVFTKPKLGSSNPKPNQTVISIPVGQNNTLKTNKTGISGLSSEKVNWADISITVTCNKTSKTSQLISTSSLKQNSHSSFSGEEHRNSDFKTNKTARTSRHWAISDMLEVVKRTVGNHFVAPPHRERTGAKTAMSSSKSKKKRRWVQNYFNSGDCQVSTLEKSSDVS